MYKQIRSLWRDCSQASAAVRGRFSGLHCACSAAACFPLGCPHEINDFANCWDARAPVAATAPGPPREGQHSGRPVEWTAAAGMDVQPPWPHFPSTSSQSGPYPGHARLTSVARLASRGDAAGCSCCTSQLQAAQASKAVRQARGHKKVFHARSSKCSCAEAAWGP